MLALRLLSEGGEGLNTELQWLLLLGVGLFFLTIIVGWWGSLRKQNQAEGQVEADGLKKKSAEDSVETSAKNNKSKKSGRKK